jgi:hypothetical protein
LVLAGSNPFLRPSPNQARCGVGHCGARACHPVAESSKEPKAQKNQELKRTKSSKEPKAQKNNEFFAAG